jgi:hypothetical protein
MLLFVAVISSCAYAQDDPDPAINLLKHTHVSTLEKGMPDTEFQSWFAQVAGPQAEIKYYKSQDCRKRTPDEIGKAFPLCVGATADAPSGFTLEIVVVVGTHVAEADSNPQLKGPPQLQLVGVIYRFKPVSGARFVSIAAACKHWLKLTRG